VVCDLIAHRPQLLLTAGANQARHRVGCCQLKRSANACGTMSTPAADSSRHWSRRARYTQLLCFQVSTWLPCVLQTAGHSRYAANGNAAAPPVADDAAHEGVHLFHPLELQQPCACKLQASPA
jgi:hypothetical protein